MSTAQATTADVIRSYAGIRGKRRLTPETRKAIRVARVNGSSIEALCEAFRLSPSSIFRALRGEGEAA